MRISPLSRVKLGLKTRISSAILILAAAPAVMNAANSIVFSGSEILFGGTYQSATSVATDLAGNLYVSQPSQNQVVKVAPDGTRTVLTFTAPLTAPRGLVVDSNNNLYVANNGAAAGTNTVVRHPLGGGADSVITGFVRPISLTVDSAGVLYVINGGNNSSPYVSKVVSGVVSPLVTTGLSQPRGIAVDTAGNLYIGDQTASAVVHVNSTTGALLSTIAPGCHPRDIAVNGAGDLYVGCVNTSTIYQIPNESGSLVLADKTVISSALIANSAGIHGLTYSSGGVLYATNGTTLVDKIQSASVDVGSWTVSFDGLTSARTVVALHFRVVAPVTVTSVVPFTEGVAFSSTDFNAPNDFQLASGTNCTAKSYGIGDTCMVNLGFWPNAIGVRHGAVVFSASGSQTLIAEPVFGTGVGPRVAYGPGVVNAFNPVINGKPLSGPVAVQVDGYGNQIVADLLNNRVVKYNPNLGAASYQEVGTGLVFPNGVAVDGAGNVYIVDTTSLYMVPFEGTTLNTAHQTVLSTDLSLPSTIRFDKAQDLYIADSFNNRILKIPNENGVLNFAHQQVLGTGLVFPVGVYPDSSGNVWVADTGNNRVVKIAADGTQTDVFIDPGQITGPLDSPDDIVLDAAGDLYIADTNNYRIIYISADGQVQSQVIQHPGAPNGGYGGIWIDPVGQLYIADFFNAITQVQDLAFPLNFPTTNVGSTSAPQVLQTSNIGNSPLTLQSLNYPTDFVEQNVSIDNIVPDCSTTLPRSLAPGKSCLVGIGFKPTNPGAISESLQVVNTDFNATTPPYNTDTFPLTGTATGLFTVTPTSLTFPVTVDGSTSPAQSVSIKNVSGTSQGLSPIVIGTNAANFAISTGTGACGSTLANGASCNVYLLFKPTGNESGTLTAQLQVATGATASLSGTAVKATLISIPNTLTFPTTPEFSSSASQTFTVYNYSNTGLNISLGTPADFEVTATTCNSALAANGGSCTVSVSFRPQQLPANPQLTEKLTVRGIGTVTLNAPVTLTGTVSAPITSNFKKFGSLSADPRVGTSRSTMMFAGQILFSNSAAQTLSVTNRTGVASYVHLSVPAGFIASSACSGLLKAGESCKVSLTFRPEKVGTNDGYLTTTLIPADGSEKQEARVAINGSGK
jgi:sugar lactone lactonase YvrE